LSCATANDASRNPIKNRPYRHIHSHSHRGSYILLGRQNIGDPDRGYYALLYPLYPNGTRTGKQDKTRNPSIRAQPPSDTYVFPCNSDLFRGAAKYSAFPPSLHTRLEPLRSPGIFGVLCLPASMTGGATLLTYSFPYGGVDASAFRERYKGGLAFLTSLFTSVVKHRTIHIETWLLGSSLMDISLSFPDTRRT